MSGQKLINETLKYTSIACLVLAPITWFVSHDPRRAWTLLGLGVLGLIVRQNLDKQEAKRKTAGQVPTSASFGQLAYMIGAGLALIAVAVGCFILATNLEAAFAFVFVLAGLGCLFTAYVCFGAWWVARRLPRQALAEGCGTAAPGNVNRSHLFGALSSQTWSTSPWGKNPSMGKSAGWKSFGAVVLLMVLLLSTVGCGGTRGESGAQDLRSPGREGDEPPAAGTNGAAEEQFRTARMDMVAKSIEGLGIKNQRVLEVMRKVPRHRFVPEDQLERAYDNRPLPIGFGQTISQPYVVALMTELLDVQAGDQVLEIGTGSGYQGAILGELTDRVWSIEIIPELASSARSKLEELGYSVSVKQADGYFGWPEHGPFDGIIVTAAPDHMPQPLIQQLAEGGNLVVPVGPQGSYQTLWRVTKRNGEITSENITDVIFVPLVRRPG